MVKNKPHQSWVILCFSWLCPLTWFQHFPYSLSKCPHLFGSPAGFTTQAGLLTKTGVILDLWTSVGWWGHSELQAWRPRRLARCVELFQVEQVLDVTDIGQMLVGWVDINTVLHYFVVVFQFYPNRSALLHKKLIFLKSRKYKGEKASCNGKWLLLEVSQATNSGFWQLKLLYYPGQII